MLWRTPILGIILGGILAVAVTLLFQVPSRPFTLGEEVLLFVLCCLPGTGVAMLFDPFPRRKKAEYLRINFYEEKH